MMSFHFSFANDCLAQWFSDWWKCSNECIYTNGMPTLTYTNPHLYKWHAKCTHSPTFFYGWLQSRPLIYTNGRPSVHIVLHFILLTIQQTTAPGLYGMKDSNSIIGGSCHKYNFCRDKSYVAINTCLSRQAPVCRNKTRLLSRQKYACSDKTFVATKYFCMRGKYVFVATQMIIVAAPANDTTAAQSLRNRTMAIRLMTVTWGGFGAVRWD